MTYEIRQGDTHTALQATLKDASGNPVDLTGASVRFLMGRSGQVTVDAGALIKDATGGVVWYVWQAGDTSTPGAYTGEFKVTFPDGSVETYPNSGELLIIINPDIGGVE